MIFVSYWCIRDIQTRVILEYWCHTGACHTDVCHTGVFVKYWRVSYKNIGVILTSVILAYSVILVYWWHTDVCHTDLLVLYWCIGVILVYWWQNRVLVSYGRMAYWCIGVTWCIGVILMCVYDTNMCMILMSWCHTDTLVTYWYDGVIRRFWWYTAVFGVILMSL